jgi:hypothetical protein
VRHFNVRFVSALSLRLK